jgi:hypothetical protein
MLGRRTVRISLFLATVLVGRAELLAVQEPATQAADPKPAADLAKASAPQAKPADSSEHRFWDKTNSWLFAGVAASRTLDYFSTLNMRRRGRQEILLTNDAVDNHAAFGAIEAAGTGVSIGASYLLHRWGHHKLEHWVSIVHIGLATTGSVRNYCLRTFHSTARPSNP